MDWTRLSYPQRLAVLRQNGPEGPPEGFWTALREGGALPLDWRPTTLIMQDYSGFSVVQEWLALCQAGHNRAGSPPVSVHLVIDHSHRPAFWDRAHPAWAHLELEYREQEERYRTLNLWARELPWLHLVPPGQGVIHQVFLERLARGWCEDAPGGGGPECVLGTDSHTPSAGALGIPAWGIGGTEALAVLTGACLPLSWKQTGRLRLEGALPAGVGAYDLALHLAALLREHPVEGAVLELAGPGLASLSVPDRMVLCNMGPEYGLRQLICPPDRQTFRYLAATGRAVQGELWQARLEQEGVLSEPAPDPDLTLTLDLASVRAGVAGPGVPHRVRSWEEIRVPAATDSVGAGLPDGFLALASLTSCTSAGHPGLLIEAALSARNLVLAGYRSHPATRCSFFPASRHVLRELNRLRLLHWLEKAGFTYCGTACGACLGQTGPLHPEVHAALGQGRQMRAVLSANRNFPGRLHPALSEVFLAAPARVVLWAGSQGAGAGVEEAQAWLPEADEVASFLGQWRWNLPEGQNLLDRLWQERTCGSSPSKARFPLVSPFDWRRFGLGETPAPREGARYRVLMVLGDDVSTDHISPVGAVPEDAPLSRWVAGEADRRGVPAPSPLPPYGAWRLHGEAVFRGTFSSPRLPLLSPQGEGRPDQIWNLWDSWQSRGGQEGFCVVAGERYGCGSARDWAAKGTLALGVRLVLARSFESIHRRNLIAAGILPVLRGDEGETWQEGMVVDWVGGPYEGGGGGWWVDLGCTRQGTRTVRPFRLDLQNRWERTLWGRGGWWGTLTQASRTEGDGQEGSV